MATEKRLIDANVLVRDINADPYRTESEKSYDRCLVHRQPTVDAVEVVRCKGCGYYKRNPSGGTYCACDTVNESTETCFFDPPSENFYCAYGERKDNDR